MEIERAEFFQFSFAKMFFHIGGGVRGKIGDLRMICCDNR
jgi:hypothetical protein